VRQLVHSSEDGSTGSRRTSKSSSLYCSTISERRGSSIVNLFSQPSFLSSSSLDIFWTRFTLTPETFHHRHRGHRDERYFCVCREMPTNTKAAASTRQAHIYCVAIQKAHACIHKCSHYSIVPNSFFPSFQHSITPCSFYQNVPEYPSALLLGG
jgi:hypothetical protein